MRLVIIRAGAAGLRLIGCAHDSFLIEDTIDGIEASWRNYKRLCAKPLGTCSVDLSYAQTVSRAETLCATRTGSSTSANLRTGCGTGTG